MMALGLQLTAQPMCRKEEREGGREQQKEKAERKIAGEAKTRRGENLQLLSKNEEEEGGKKVRRTEEGNVTFSLLLSAWSKGQEERCLTTEACSPPGLPKPLYSRLGKVCGPPKPQHLHCTHFHSQPCDLSSPIY